MTKTLLRLLSLDLKKPLPASSHALREPRLKGGIKPTLRHGKTRPKPKWCAGLGTFKIEAGAFHARQRVSQDRARFDLAINGPRVWDAGR
jgi:hypothetical protein